jgi:histidinol dehydrogenase
MDSFYRKITFQEVSREGLRSLSGTIMTLAAAEQLQAHSRAVSIRINSTADE